MEKDELRDKLMKLDSTYMRLWGQAPVARDLYETINDNEQVIQVLSARKHSLLQVFKGTKFIRSYLAITNQRIIYVESGQRIFSFIPFLKKKIIVNRWAAAFDVRKNKSLDRIFYPEVLEIQTGGEMIEIPVDAGVMDILFPKETEEIEEAEA